MKKSTKETISELLFTFAWCAFILVACQFIVGLPMQWLLGSNFSKPFWMLIYYVLNYGLTISLILFLTPKISKKFKTSSAELGVNRYPTFIDIGLVPIGYIGYIMLSAFLTNLMSLLPWFDAKQAQDVGFNYLGGPAERVIAMIAIVFIAPIAEEIIMRGWLYGKVRKNLSIWASVLLVSLLFGVLHGQWNVGVSVFALSVALCSLREVTGSIWSGVLLHILNNGIAFYILYVMI